MQQGTLYSDEGRGTLLDLKGEIVGERFLLLERVACGSYSEIHLARNLSPINDEPETVIVKILNLGLQGELDPAMERTLLENMELEALTLGRFMHANVVRLYNCGTGVAERTGRHFYYLVLEHMAGGDLFRFCRARPLSIEQMLLYAGQICDALSYAHAHNTVHRDVKPNNILLSLDRRSAKLLDFGTARLLDRDNGLITRVGTAVYSAPEHYSHHQTAVAVTPAADVYSLAKTILFLMTGESPAYIAQQQIKSVPPKLKPMPWAQSLVHVLRKATCERPDDRYQSAQDFYKELRDVPDLTFVGPRSIEQAQLRPETPREPPEHTRIEVPVNSTPPQNYGEVTVNVLRRLIEQTKNACATLSTILIAFTAWISPRLQRTKVALHYFGTSRCRTLHTTPRKLGARILAVIVIALVLLVAPPYLINWWRALPKQGMAAEAGNVSSTGKEATTSTDLNMHSGPGSREPKIGLAERSSHVRILSSNGDNTWCEIQVLEHGRPKNDPNSADRGWVSKRYLIFD